MLRYPYFCVELQKKDEQYVFVDNERPIVITDSLDGVELNSEESNFHMIAFAYQGNWIEMDVFHGLTLWRLRQTFRLLDENSFLRQLILWNNRGFHLSRRIPT